MIDRLKSLFRVKITLADDTNTLSMILVEFLEEIHAPPILWKFNRGGSTLSFPVITAFVIARSRPKTQIVLLVFTQWFPIYEVTSARATNHRFMNFYSNLSDAFPG